MAVHPFGACLKFDMYAWSFFSCSVYPFVLQKHGYKLIIFPVSTVYVPHPTFSPFQHPFCELPSGQIPEPPAPNRPASGPKLAKTYKQ